MAAEDCTVKYCTRCGKTKTVSEFNKDKTNTGTGLQSRCRLCQKAMRHDWYLRNREREIAKVIEWAKINPEKVREKDRRRAIARPGRTTASARASAQRNPKRTRELKSAWKRLNASKVRAGARAAYAKNPHKNLSKSHKRRAIQRGSGGSYTQAQIKELNIKQRGRCACCRKVIKRFHADHVIPLAKGGRNDIGNIQLLCPSCNSRKGAKDPIQFMQENGFLI